MNATTIVAGAALATLLRLSKQHTDQIKVADDRIKQLEAAAKQVVTEAQLEAKLKDHRTQYEQMLAQHMQSLRSQFAAVAQSNAGGGGSAQHRAPQPQQNSFHQFNGQQHQHQQASGGGGFAFPASF